MNFGRTPVWYALYDGIGAYIRECGKLLLRLAAWERLVGWVRDMLRDHNIK